MKIRSCNILEPVIFKHKADAYPYAACLTQGRPTVGNWPCIVEIDRIVIREVQYQLEVNRCRNKEVIVKGNFGWVCLRGRGAPELLMGASIVEIDLNRCRNEEIIVKGSFGWVWPMWAGRPMVGNGAMHKVQYQFEVNRCRNEKNIVTGNFGWVWSMWAGRPRIDCFVIREVQYQFEVKQCRNEEL
ncbi:hypothetical protein DPMN_155115 [Dreissena polymorpha]|uniref:Uncharacterized protein n=1 Tax=Dreissena polymorpha TaxID=45954 RepID=A0A9D4FPS7_DREPO|nr:hypothetical protein DPMN_155115 [Dreissena polymorpha]